MGILILNTLSWSPLGINVAVLKEFTSFDKWKYVCCLLLLCYVDLKKKDAGLFYQWPDVVCVICFEGVLYVCTS